MVTGISYIPSMSKIPEIPKTLVIELLPGYRSIKTHTPSFWEYTYRWAQSRKTLWGIEGAYFYQGSAGDVKNIIKHMTQTVPGFVCKNQDLVLSRLGVSDYQSCNFVIAPDGQFFALTSGSCFYRTAFPYGKKDVAFRYLTARHDEDNDKLRHASWGPTQALLETLEDILFPAAWKVARKEFLAEAKKSGTLAAAMERQKARRLANRTNRKMEVCMQTKDLIQELEQFLKDVNDGTATQRQVGQLYFSMNNLASLNRRLKTLFPKGDKDDDK